MIICCRRSLARPDIGAQGKARVEARSSQRRKGNWYAVGAHTIWGLFPIYWKLLRHVPAQQLLCHRILWSCVLLLAVVLASGQWAAFRRTAFKPTVLAAYTAAAVIVSINWFTYVWSVNAGFIVEASLGYYINPLMSVFIGVIFLRERLRPWQWVPVGLAGLAVLYLTYSYGTPPWIALVLASTWAVYGLIKKIAPLGSLHGLTLETGLLLPLVLIYLVYVESAGTGAFIHGGPASDLLLIGAGVVTVIPLFLFALALRRIPLVVAGILQYISPTLQFLCGVVLYREPFTVSRLIGFSIVWIALAIFGVEGFLAYRAQSAYPTRAGP
jgi:chloramphenicol-sensitive protein RarD